MSYSFFTCVLLLSLLGGCLQTQSPSSLSHSYEYNKDGKNVALWPSSAKTKRIDFIQQIGNILMIQWNDSKRNMSCVTMDDIAMTIYHVGQRSVPQTIIFDKNNKEQNMAYVKSLLLNYEKMERSKDHSRKEPFCSPAPDDSIFTTKYYCDLVIKKEGIEFFFPIDYKELEI